MNSVKHNQIEKVLHALHKDATNDFLRIGKGMKKSGVQSMQPINFEHAYLPISKEQGKSIKALIIENHCQQVVEFGTSFGISTIYLADAVRQTGGKVITTELLESKARRAKQNIHDAGLLDYVEVRIGDAMKTLRGHATPIDFLFLDGWKDLYLPVFKLLEPQFHSETLVYADNMDMEETQLYANYLSKTRNKYSTQVVDNGKAFLTFIS